MLEVLDFMALTFRQKEPAFTDIGP